MGLRVASDLEC